MASRCRSAPPIERVEALEPRVLLSTVAFPGAFQPTVPLGSLAYAATHADDFAAPSETDGYTLSLDAGRSISLQLTPSDPSVVASVELFDVNGVEISLGSAQAVGAGESVVLGPLSATAGGAYRFDVTSVAGAGAYELDVVLDAAIELESAGLGGNDATGTAQPLDASAVNLPNGASTLGVLGQIDEDSDFFQVTLSQGDAVSAMLGSIEGPTTGSPRYRVASQPTQGTVRADHIETADLNNDTIPDLVVASAISDNLSVVLGNGDGTFGLRTDITTGNNRHFALGMIDGDGFLDIVTANNHGTNDVSVLLNNGDGTFSTTAIDFAAPSHAEAVALGQMNGDLFLDLVIAFAGTDQVGVAFGDGAGNFAEPVLTTLPDVRAVTVGHLDADAHADVVVGDGANSQLVVLAGQGDGTFAAPLDIPVGHFPYYIALDDIDGDGAQDILSPNRLFDGAVTLIYGNGDGSFAAPASVAVDSDPVIVRAADLDGDGHKDLVTANHRDDTASVVFGLGDGTFGERIDFSVGNLSFNNDPVVAVSDLEGDGDLDLVFGIRGVEETIPHLAVRPLGLTLHDSGGNPVTSAVSGPAPVDGFITNFVAPANGTYFLEVHSEETRSYGLTLSIDAGVDLDDGVVFADAQGLTEL